MKSKWIFGEFGMYFKASSINKILTMQLLTHEIMEDLINFRKTTDMLFDVVIKNNNIYIRFDCGKLFEINSIRNGAFEEKMLKKYYDILNFTYILSKKIMKVVDELEI